VDKQGRMREEEVTVNRYHKSLAHFRKQLLLSVLEEKIKAYSALKDNRNLLTECFATAVSIKFYIVFHCDQNEMSDQEK
jgi:hypothetical protein